MKSISYVLFKYPFIELVIENVTPLRKVYSDEVHLCNNFSFGNIELVKYLREELNTKELVLVLILVMLRFQESIWRLFIMKLGILSV